MGGGSASWAAVAGYAQARAATWLYLAARGDHFHESAAVDETGAAGRIFWLKPRASSPPATDLAA